MHDVFISYNTADLVVAEYVRGVLESSDISCWIATRNIPIGASFAEVIPGAIRSAEFFVIIVSANSMVSEQVKNELNLAVDYKRRIIAFRMDDAPLTDVFQYYLGTRQWICANNRMDIAVQEMADHIYKEKKQKLPEKKKTEDEPVSFKRIMGRVFLVVLVMLVWVIYEVNALFYTESYVANMENLFDHSWIVMAIIFLLVAPVVGGKRKLLIEILKGIRDIFTDK